MFISSTGLSLDLLLTIRSPGVPCRPSLQSLLAGLGWHAAYCHLLHHLGSKSLMIKRKIERRKKKQSLSRVVDEGPGVSRLPSSFHAPRNTLLSPHSLYSTSTSKASFLVIQAFWLESAKAVYSREVWLYFDAWLTFSEASTNMC